MSRVAERVFIEAPWVQASGALERRFGLSAHEAQGRCRFTLIAPLAEGTTVAREVDAEVRRLPIEGNYTSRYAIAWEPGKTARGVPTPGFDGTVTLRAGQDYDESELTLEGGYIPPGGAAGRIFDEMIGRRIAHATLGALLEGVRAELREDHRRTEAGKHRR
ncbi:MAG: hypothetical protein JOZ24_02540 [Candidatus Eremiobacteraeota bacterium]|nr:hypothetical protein [Candidatus Eremiobacteraeota bacterium]